MMLGPIAGSFIFDLVGFKGTFVIFGALIVPLSIVILCFLPNVYDVKVRVLEAMGDNVLFSARSIEQINTQREGKKLRYSDLICNQRILHAALCAMATYLVWGALEPVLNLRLTQDYELPQSQQGLFFGIAPLCYTLSTFLTPFIFPHWIERRVILITSLVGLGISALLVGPIYPEKSV